MNSLPRPPQIGDLHMADFDTTTCSDDSGFNGTRLTVAFVDDRIIMLAVNSRTGESRMQIGSRLSYYSFIEDNTYTLVEDVCQD